MSMRRRDLLAAGVAAAFFAQAMPAAALGEAEARDHIEKTVEEIRVLLREAGGGDVGPAPLREIMARRANLPQIAKFCAGRTWRDMNDAQRTRYVEAFSHYIAVTYARRFRDFSGEPQITIGRATDAGRRGILIESPILMPDGKSFAVEWLVSDRGGRVEIVDLVIEGISLAATQREEIGAMVDRRGGDVDALIEALAGTS